MREKIFRQKGPEVQAAMELMARSFAEKEVVINLKKEEFNRELVRKMRELSLFG